MRKLTILLTGATLASAALLASAPANAQVLFTFASSPTDGTNAVSWTRNASTHGGTLATNGTPVVNFTIFNDPLTFGPDIVSADFALNVSDATDATNHMGQLEQWHMGSTADPGTFSFTSVGAFTYNGHNYGAGTNLLSGLFEHTRMIANGGSTGLSGSDGSIYDPASPPAVVEFTSGILNLGGSFDHSFSFALTPTHAIGNPGGCATLTVVTTCTASIASFDSPISGQFSAAVPEPGAWALMILGFGGAGAMLRRRRSLAAVAAA